MRYFLAFLFIGFSFLSTDSIASPKTFCLASSQTVSTQILKLAKGSLGAQCTKNSQCDSGLTCGCSGDIHNPMCVCRSDKIP